MSLYFCNKYPAKIWVAVMWFEPICEPPEKIGWYWRRVGWFSIYPGSCKTVLPNARAPDTGVDLSDLVQYLCFYAQAQDGAKWSGPYKRDVTNEKFDRDDCHSYTGYYSWMAGFRLFDTHGNDDYTVNLVP